MKLIDFLCLLLTLIDQSLDRHRHQAGDRIVGGEGLGLELTPVPLEPAIERFFRMSLAGLGKNDSSVVDVNLDPALIRKKVFALAESASLLEQTNIITRH